MLLIFVVVFHTIISSQSVDIQPWETYLQLGSIKNPLGLTVNQSLLSHQHFTIGYLCLHSFMYDTAQEAFQLAIETDPTLVEAHIGRLLGHKQPIWKYTNRSGALAVWDETWSIFNEHAVTLTSLQSAYINTAYQWYESENITHGEIAFLNAMINLTNEYPDNNDARVLLGLAYLNVAQTESAQLNVLESPALFSARKILQIALTNEPLHSGCLHYLIHAFDIQRLETSLLGVPYAHQYSQVAVTASHGQHMPSHIWTRIGSWSLAHAADIQSIQVSISLCLRKQQSTYTEFDLNKISSLTLANLITRLNQTQIDHLLYCDRNNRGHSQQWLVYTYLQTGQYNKSMTVLNDLIVSYRFHPNENYYIRFIYRAQPYVIANVFFWAMYNREKNQAIFIRTMNDVLVDFNSSSILEFPEDSSLIWYEVVIRFADCIRLLLTETNQTNNAILIDYHLERLLKISTELKSQLVSKSIRVDLMRLQIIALGWCFNGSMNNCLTNLAQATQIESSISDDYNRPDILHIRASELFALYLLITRQYYPTLNSTYQLNNETISVQNYSPYALKLYQNENKTEPFRAVNLLGMARAHAQLGHEEQACRIYADIQHTWIDSIHSSAIDHVVITEANDYSRTTKCDRYRNHGSFFSSNIVVISSFLFFSFILS